VADELAEGFFRAILAVIRWFFRLILEAIVHLVVEVMFELLGHFIAAIGRRFAAIYDRLFERLMRLVRGAVLAHCVAIILLLSGGFAFGFSASALYHADQGYDLSASSNVEP
jgi:hypothetical protein